MLNSDIIIGRIFVFCVLKMIIVKVIGYILLG